MAFVACLVLCIFRVFGGEFPPDSMRDELVIKGDVVRGQVLGIEANVIRFKTIYGEGELRIPLSSVESWKRDGVDQVLPRSKATATSPPEPGDNKPESSDSKPASPRNLPALTNAVPQVTSTNPAAAVQWAQASPESIDAQIQEAQELQQTWMEMLPHRLAIRYFNHANNWLDENIHMRLGLAYTSLAMGATGRLFGDQGAAGGDFDLFGRWRLWGQKTGNTGTIGFNVRDRHSYTPTPPSRLGVHLGSAWNVTSGFTDTGFELTQAYIDQAFLDGNVAFRVGQMYQDLHFDTYSFKSQKSYFLNAAFSDNPAVAFPGAGVGFATLIRPVKDWYVISGVGDAQERKLDSGLEGFFSDKLFSGAELGWAPSSGPLRFHSFSVFGWFTPAKSDSQGEDGQGLALTYEWTPERDFSIFARYSWSATSATLVEQLGTTGIVWKKPFHREHDFLGVAFGWGVPTQNRPELPETVQFPNSDRRSQGILESFYRFQVTPSLQITPDVQLLIRPSDNPEYGIIVVGGIRARLAL